MTTILLYSEIRGEVQLVGTLRLVVDPSFVNTTSLLGVWRARALRVTFEHDMSTTYVQGHPEWEPLIKEARAFIAKTTGADK